MSEVTHIGVRVDEITGRATPSVVGAPTSIAGFAVWAPEATSEPRTVTSFADFQKQFGAASAGSYGALAIKGYFENGGFMARVVGMPALVADVEAAAGVLKAHETALAQLERVDVQLIVLPEADAPEISKLALTHCANMGDRFYISHVPEKADLEGMRTFVKDLREDVQSGAAYGPWIKVVNSQGKVVSCPPSGHIAGIYARTAQQRGIWKAPAGNASVVRGAVGVTMNVTDPEHFDLVVNHAVNAVRALPGRGIVLDSARTLSINTKWIFVNVRLLMNFVKSSLKNNLDWAKYEPNDAVLWGRIKHNAITPFLMGLWRQGAFGTGAPEDLFTVVVDESINSPADIEQGKLNVVVTFYPSRPAESILIQIGQQDAGTIINET